MSWMLRCLAAGIVAALAGCDGEQAEAELRVPPGEGRGKPRSLPEKTATRPASPCDWIPASEVEAVVGKLSGTPRKHEGGCFYPLPVDSITIARRAKADQVREALERAGMKSDWPAEPEDTGGVFIQVTVGVGADERPAELGFATLGSWVGDDSLLAAEQPAEGWDYRRSLPGKPNFLGRAGTVSVTVEGGTYGMNDDVLAVLAGRVRDRIPDLPFMEPGAAAGVPRGPDPCSVLSRDDAEAVLGPLVVSPYRVREGGALADPGGRSCAYYSGKHRALVLTPHYSDGAREMRFIRSRGGLGLVGVVDGAAEAADTLEGPWDEVAIGVYGQLAMITGDRMLEIAYLTSSTDMAGAIRLAGKALPRLASARWPRTAEEHVMDHALTSLAVPGPADREHLFAAQSSDRAGRDTGGRGTDRLRPPAHRRRARDRAVDPHARAGGDARRAAQLAAGLREQPRAPSARHQRAVRSPHQESFP